MILKSKILDRGSISVDHGVFSDDCKISFKKGGIFIKHNFCGEPIGIVNKIIDNGSSLEIEAKIDKPIGKLNKWKKFVNYLSENIFNHTVFYPEGIEGFYDYCVVGIVKEREGSIIKDFQLTEVSIAKK